jgi:hypothetical protein
MTNCAIWPDATADVLGHGVEGRKVKSARAGGVYRITSSAEAVLAAWDAAKRAKLTTWLVEQRRAGVENPLITSEVLIKVELRKPLRYLEKKRSLFLGLLSRDPDFTDILNMENFANRQTKVDRAWVAAQIEARTEDEASYFMTLMHEEGLFISRPQGDFRLSSAGYKYLDEISAGGAPTDQAFVAMWFDKTMEAAFEEGFASAIREAGYRPLRIDKKEHNNKIDDEIIAEIRRSRFVVADFTSAVFKVGDEEKSEPRGGVYFEAGFALGLGTPVIWTVKSDLVKYVHFDTRQYAHITWTSPEDLRTQLTNRIRAVISQGPLAS